MFTIISFRWIEIWIILTKRKSNKNRKIPKQNFEPYQSKPKTRLNQILFLLWATPIFLRERRSRRFGRLRHIRYDVSIHVPILRKAKVIL